MNKQVVLIILIILGACGSYPISEDAKTDSEVIRDAAVDTTLLLVVCKNTVITSGPFIDILVKFLSSDPTHEVILTINAFSQNTTVLHLTMSTPCNNEPRINARTISPVTSVAVSAQIALDRTIECMQLD